MPIFWFKGRVTLDGVDFEIEAETLEQAKELARRGEHDEADWVGAEMVDWTIRPDTGKIDE